MERIADGRYLNLVPSSMQGGNTVSDDASLSMTGPGSPGVMPVPETMDRLPQPEIGAEHPAVFNEHHQAVDGHPGSDVSGGWNQITETGNGGWKQL